MAVAAVDPSCLVTVVATVSAGSMGISSLARSGSTIACCTAQSMAVASAWRHWGAVALLGRPWRLWRYGQIKRHGRKPYSIRHRAFVAFVAFYSCLGLANKKKKDDTLHPPADNITAR